MLAVVVLEVLFLDNAYTFLSGTTYNIVVGTGGSRPQPKELEDHEVEIVLLPQDLLYVYTGGGGGGGGGLYPDAGFKHPASGGSGAGRATSASARNSSTGFIRWKRIWL